MGNIITLALIGTVTSLLVAAVGLFCGRWTLGALGELDYGLMVS